MHLKQALLKKAENLIAEHALANTGSVLSSQILPGIGPIGHLVGLLSGNAKAEIKDRGHLAKSLIPGVGSYRTGQVARAVADESGTQGRKNLLHETIGRNVAPVATGLAGAGAGAGIGLALSDGDEGAMTTGALIGAGVGALAPEATAAFLALINKRRTASEQHAADQGSGLRNYIPGVGAYNSYKRQGYGYDKYIK